MNHTVKLTLAACLASTSVMCSLANIETTSRHTTEGSSGPGCATDNDCPQADVVCSSYRCNAATSKCELIYEPDGTVVDNPGATSDCMLTVCDRQGTESVEGDKVHIEFAEFDSPCAGGVCNATGQCGECNFPQQCGVVNDCLTAVSCNATSNTCERTCDAVGDNQDLSNEKNDCTKRVCTSECGSTCSQDCGDTIEIDDVDLPTNVCETCSGGEVVNVANNTSPVACDEPTYCFDGQCVGCVTDVECMNDVTGDCGTPKCASGICVADGNIDNGDLPNDNNECTDDECTNGVPSNPSLAEGTACNNNTQVCDGAAMNPQCVDCTTSHLQHCSSTAGNCQQPACTGNNTCTESADNVDLPNDNNECTDDVCTNGVPSNPSAVEGTACNNNTEVCNGAAMTPLCVECTPSFDANCPLGKECSAQTFKCVLL